MQCISRFWRAKRKLGRRARNDGAILSNLTPGTRNASEYRCRGCRLCVLLTSVSPPTSTNSCSFRFTAVSPDRALSPNPKLVILTIESFCHPRRCTFFLRRSKAPPAIPNHVTASPTNASAQLTATTTNMACDARIRHYHHAEGESVRGREPQGKRTNLSFWSCSKGVPPGYTKRARASLQNPVHKYSTTIRWRE